MEYSTPYAIRQIKSNNHKTMWINGEKQCPLQAMSFAFKYHRLDITDTGDSLNIVGTKPVVRNDKFLLSR
mgnify:FL=1